MHIETLVYRISTKNLLQLIHIWRSVHWTDITEIVALRILFNENEFFHYRLCLHDDYKRKSTNTIMMNRRAYVFYENAVEIIQFSCVEIGIMPKFVYLLNLMATNTNNHWNFIFFLHHVRLCMFVCVWYLWASNLLFSLFPYVLSFKTFF